MATILFAALLAAPGQEIGTLIEDLGSDAIAVREDAAAKLVDLGPKAVPSLQKATADRDLEVAGRARILIRQIRIREKLTPTLLKVIPNIDLRLISGGDATWTEVFWEAVDEQKAGNLGLPDLDRLVAPALQAARLGTAKRSICEEAGRHRLARAVPEIVKLLRDTNGDVRASACRALGRIDVAESAAALMPVLEDRYLYARGEAAEALGALKAKGASARLVELLGDRQPYVQSRAAAALEAIGAAALPAVEKALEHRDERVRTAAEGVKRAIESRQDP